MDTPSFNLSGNIVDVVNRRTFPGTLWVDNGVISRIVEDQNTYEQYILPGLVDAHVHIESSMLVPAEFARLATMHGTTAVVSDPHEIANVLGMEGIHFMISNGQQVPFLFYFGAPSCVPATPFESSGAVIDAKGIEALMAMDQVVYLAEVMNYPGVINGDPEVMAKIAAARRHHKVIDGHAPGVGGGELLQYARAGITTDHECSTLEEALEKIAAGMKILIRQGSAARNYDALSPLLASHPGEVMFCSDDLHPDSLVAGHINLLVKKALEQGHDLYNVLRAVTLNPRQHYGLENGLLQQGHRADMVVVDNLEQFNVLRTYAGGILAASGGEPLLEPLPGPTPNKFHAQPVSAAQLAVPALGNRIRVIQATDGELLTAQRLEEAPLANDLVVSNTQRDILKLVVLNRYQSAPPAIAFISGFGLQHGAMASTIAHDSHNIIALGVNDEDIAQAINLLTEHRGGIALAMGTQQSVIPLPVAGIMTNADGFTTAQRYQQIEQAVKDMGCPLQAPFMTLSFMALLVIPELKLSDKGLFDGKRFEQVGLFAE